MERQGRWGQLILLGGVVLLAAAAGAAASGPTAGSGAGHVSTASPPTAGPEEGNVSVYATGAGGFGDASGIEAAIEDGTLEPADDVVVGETLVVAIDSERLVSTLAERTGPTTDRFFTALEDGPNVTLVQTNPNPNRAPKVLVLDPESTTAYRTGTTTYLAIETDAVDVDSYPPWEESGLDVSLHGGEAFAVVVGDGTDDRLRGPPVTFHRVEAEFFGVHGVVAPEVVNGSVKTYVGPEANVTVRATLGNGSAIRTRLEPDRSSVTEYSLDFRAVAPGTNYTLELLHDGDVVDSQEGTVREPEAALWDADVTAVEAGSHDARLEITAELSHGGKVIVRDGFGARVGSRPVPAGRAAELSIRLRFGAGGESVPDPDTLQVQAVRGGKRVEQRYRGQDAALTLDVSEYEWETANWTRPSDPGSGVGAGRGSERTVDNGTAGGDSADDGLTTGIAGDGTANGTTGDGTTDESQAGVGSGPTGTGSGLAGPGSLVGIVGVVAVLGTAGYLLKRRGVGR